MMNALKNFWQQRQPRERKLLAVGMAFVLFSVLYIVLIDPALSGRQRLQKSLPLLQQQANELQSLLTQAAALPAPAPAAAAVSLTREALEESLKHKGLTAKSVTLSNEGAKLQFADVAFASVMDWLREAQQTAHWQVSEATINSQSNAGIVNANISLVQNSHE